MYTPPSVSAGGPPEERTDQRVILDAITLAGEILLASGAEIFRVEETVDRMAKAYGVESIDAFVLSSGIFITAGSAKERAFARVRHIPLSGARLDRVNAVNQLSREIESGKYTPLEAHGRLEEIKRKPLWTDWQLTLAAGIGSGCFSILFGGDLVDAAVSCLAGLVLYYYLLFIVRGRLSKIVTNISGAALVTIFSIVLYRLGFGHHLNIITIGSIIPLIPGVAFTNAIRDIADQDYIAGTVRMLDVLLVAFCIACGVGVVTMAYYRLLPYLGVLG